MNGNERSTAYVPERLKQFPQWVCWTYTRRTEGQRRRGKVAIRIPVLLNPPPRNYRREERSPKEKLYADPHDPSVWLTFRDAAYYYRARYSSPGDWKKNQGRAERWRRIVKGVGFVLTDRDPFVCIDLDDCRKGRTIADWALEIIKEIDSYAEVSPSGRGVHIFAVGRPPEDRIPTTPLKDRDGNVEMYYTKQFVTVTGKWIDGTPREPRIRKSEIEALYSRLKRPVVRPPIAPPQSIERPSAPSSPSPLAAQNPPSATIHTLFSFSDDEIIKRIAAGKYGADFKTLFEEGDWKRMGFPSQNEADFGLCYFHLYFWTAGWSANYKERMDVLFRRSSLFRPKWDEKHHTDGRTYGELTLDNAIAKAVSEGRPTWMPRNPEKPAERRKKTNGPPDQDELTFLLRWPRKGRKPLWVTASELRDAWRVEEPKLSISTVHRRLEKCRPKRGKYVKRRKTAGRNGQKNKSAYEFNLTPKGVRYCEVYKPPGERWTELRKRSQTSDFHET